ncbi:uncharacterized protein AB9X84_018171 isoform 2-T2 [Acanthopagrus schlegelii]
MATDFTQDTVLHFLQSSGGSVKNSDLLLHFRNFIRDHADRDRNREHFKKFVNSVATVQQLDGVSYVVLRKKFGGLVPGGGDQGSSGPVRPAGKNKQPYPENAKRNPAVRAEKPRQKPPLKEVTTPAPPGDSDGKTVLSAAGIVLNNNNNNLETSFNLRQQQVIKTPEACVRPAAAEVVSQISEKKQVRISTLSEPPAQGQLTKVGHLRVGPSLPPEPTPVVSSIRHDGAVSQQPPVPEPLRGRQYEGALQQERPLHPQVVPHRIRHRPSYKTAVSYDEDEEEEDEVPMRPGSAGGAWPVSTALGDKGRAMSASSPCIVDPPTPPSIVSSSSSSSERKLPKIYIHDVKGEMLPSGGSDRRLESGVGVRGQWAGPGSGPGSAPIDPMSTRCSLPSEVGHHSPSPDRTPEVLPHHDVLMDHRYPQPAGVQLEPRQGLGQQLLSSHSSILSSSSDTGSPRGSGWNSSYGDLQARSAEVVSQIPEKKQVRISSLSEPPAQGRLTKVGQLRVGPSLPPEPTPVVSAIRHDGAVSQQPPVPEPLRGRQYEGALQQERPLHPQVVPHRIRHRPSYKTAVSYDEDEEEEDKVPMRPGSAGGAWPISNPLGDIGRAMSASSPCIVDPPTPPSIVSSSSSSSERKLPKIYIHDVKGEMLPSGGSDWRLESGVGVRGQWAGPGSGPGSAPIDPMSTRCSLPSKVGHHSPSPDRTPEVLPHHDALMDHRYPQPAGVQLEPRQGLGQQLLSSHSSILSSSSDTGSPRGSGWNSSYGDLQARSGKAGDGSIIQEVLHRTQRTKFESVMHHVKSKTLAPWHRSSEYLYDYQESTAHDQPRHVSTDDLYNNREGADSSESSTFSPVQPQSTAVVRRLNSQVRSRMCRSLGADLDQILQEEARGGVEGGSEAARLNRLHLISSSLSLHYNLSSSSLSSCSTPPRCHSLADLVEGVEGKGLRRSLPAASSSSTAPHEGPSRQSLVPLESREHTWLVKGAAGAWPDIYSLFREDSSLLNRRDFISGFTVLHWIAKHGDHRALNTLWYGAEKAGLAFDINARSTCGHTPLHIAAIHGHKNIMRLLVSKFKANLKLRDTAGKKPWQYLSCTASSDVFQLLGAPPQAAWREEVGVGRVEKSLKSEQHQRRRRRHHFSSASGERPLTISGTTKVKRSSSIAAFLKHKSLRGFQGHQSDSSI